MMLPIVISMSVAPVSYFFWASALLPMAAMKMMAVENAAHRRATKDISFLPNEPMNVSALLETSNGLLAERVNTLRQALSISTSAARAGLSVCLVRQHS
jgi:hypothetical protein